VILDQSDAYAAAILWGMAIAVVIFIAAFIQNRRKGFRMACPYCHTGLSFGTTVCPKCGRDVPGRG